MKKLVFLQDSKSFEKLLEVKEISPFLLMNYVGPIKFSLNEKKLLSKNIQPQKGLDIFNVVYSSKSMSKESTKDELHKDDLKWMNGDSGLLHSENELSEADETVQLWINLPSGSSSTSHNHTTHQVPLIQLDNDAGKLRVVMGEYSGMSGAFKTLSGTNIWDMRLNANHTSKFLVPEGQTAAIFVLSGKITLSDGNEVNEAELAILERSGESFTFTTKERTKLLFLGGEPINEGVIGYAPFELDAPESILKSLQNLSTVEF